MEFENTRLYGGSKLLSFILNMVGIFIYIIHYEESKFSILFSVSFRLYFVV